MLVTLSSYARHSYYLGSHTTNKRFVREMPDIISRLGAILSFHALFSVVISLRA